VHAQGARTQVLDTPGYTVRIEIRCPEGEVSCADVGYRGESKRSRRSLALAGRSVHATCADGVTPCRFLGWQFANGGYTYFVGTDGRLVVRNGDRVLVDQAGTWR
jgi:hypothetical protein